MKLSFRKLFVAVLIALMVMIMAAYPALAASNIRVSVDSNGVQANALSWHPALSADGRYVAFESYADNLVSGDTNGYPDIFVYDTQNGTTMRASVSSAGAQGNGYSEFPDISADGRYVVFNSDATTLVSGDTNNSYDVFLHDNQSSTTTRVSVSSSGVQGNSGSGDPSISADGRYVAFSSSATNLVGGDTNGSMDVFVRDTQSGVTTRVSVSSSGAQGNGVSYYTAISPDGRYVAFSSYASNLVSGDTNGRGDIFLRDTQSRTTRRISVSSSGAQGNENSMGRMAISANGRYVAFESYASNLVSGDTNGDTDIFLRDIQSGITTRISVDSSGAQANDNSGDPSISADGRYIAFSSNATNLISDDTNNLGDVFVRDTQNNITTRVSVDPYGVEANGDSGAGVGIGFSADGRYVAFSSDASNFVLGDTNGAADVFVRDNSSITVSTNPASWDFGTQTVGIISVAQVFTIQNNDSADIEIGPLSTTGDFSLSSNACDGQILAPADTCSFEVAFTPADINLRSGYVSIPVEGRIFPENIALIGTGFSEPPNIDILSVFSNGGNLISQIDLSDPEGDPLSGTVKILQDAALPIAVTFEAITTACFDVIPEPLELWLNGNLVGTMPIPEDCICEQGITTRVFSGTVVTGYYLPGVENTWTFHQRDPDYATPTGWARITVNFSDGSLQNACLFDASGTGCTTTDICVGNEGGALSGTFIQPASGQVFASQPYSNTILPSYLDTSVLLPGNYTLYASVEDGFNPPASDTQDFMLADEPRLYINPSNIAPLLDPIGNQSMDELATLVFTATARDSAPLTNTLTFSLDAGAPAGAVIDPTTGAFIWIPTEADGPGVYTITVRVTDNGIPSMDDFWTFTITVKEVNTAPILDPISNQSVDELVTLIFTATAGDADLPANTLTFSLDAGAPAGASIDPSTGAFTWTPTGADGPGVYIVTIRVTDNGIPSMDDFWTFTITVNEVNTAPLLDPISDQSVDELFTLVFTVTASDLDLPANTLAFSLDAGAPAGASIDPSTGTFTWTPTEADGPGVYTVTVRVTDNGVPSLSDSDTINITVSEVNTAPVLDPISDQNVDELVTLVFTATASDVDLPANTLTISLDAGAPVGASIDPSTGAFTWTPTEADGPGVYTVTVRVTDNGAPSLSDSDTINITVSEVNTAPVLDPVGDHSVDELVTLVFTATASDADLPANSLTFSLDAGAPPGASIDPTTGVFTWTPTEAQGPGVYTVTIRVTDNGAPSLSDSDTINITVGEVNTAPLLDPISDQSVDELFTLVFTATASDADLPANTLTFSLDGGAPVGASIDPSTGTFTWTPTEADGPGFYTVTVRVTDNGAPSLSDSDTINITVSEVNTAPLLDPISEQSVDELVTLVFTATASDVDLPANTLTFSLDAGAPVGASIDPSTGAFTWTPTEAQGPGVYTVTVRVTDNGAPSLSDSDTINITVSEVNTAPLLDPISNQSVDELVTLIFTATASDADLPANTLTFSLDAGAPPGASIDPSTGTFTWTPTEADGPGVYTVTVRVTDNGIPSKEDFETIQITVNEVNQTPVANAGDNQIVTTGDLVQLNGSASSDPDSQPLAFSWVQTGGSPQMYLSDPASDVPTFTASLTGIYTFTLTVTDTYMATDSDEVVITVLAVPETDLAVSLNRSGLTTVVFTIVVTNLGPNAADGAIIHDELSPAFTNIAWTCAATNGAACTNASGTGNLLDEMIAQLPSGGTITFTIVGKISMLDDDSNQVTVTAPAGVDDTNMTNNEASISRSYRYALSILSKKSP